MYDNPSPGPQPNPSSNPDIGIQNPQEQPKPPIDNIVEQVQQQQQQQAPQSQPTQPKPKPKKQGKPLNLGPLKGLIPVIVVLAILGSVVYYGYKAFLNPSNVTSIAATTGATTINGNQTSTIIVRTENVYSCTNITSSGTYYLAQNIRTQMQSGSCINVMASNVKVVGNGNGIYGAGPFVTNQPYTYAISIHDASNVSLQDITLSKFSYGVYLYGANDSHIDALSIGNMTISGIALYSSYNNIITNTTIAGTESQNGALVLASGGNNKLLFDTIRSNNYIGVIVNSSGNMFKSDSFLSNPIDMECNVGSSFRYSNNFSSTSCSVNDYCNFAHCSLTNVPSNLSTLNLQKSVSTCGAITSPGSYALSKDISFSQFQNISNPAALSQPCIKISAPNVQLTCNGHSISNSTFAIFINRNYNVSVSNCNLVSNKYGVYLNDSFNINFAGLTLKNNVFGLYLNTSQTGTVSGSTLINNVYGIYLNTTNGYDLSKTTASNNTYGIYLNSEPIEGNIYSNLSLLNSMQEDLFCSPNSYSSDANLFQSTTCGVTDCNWASCKLHKLPPLSQYPLNNCQVINEPGNYTLTSNSFTFSTCFTIQASNVKLSCNGHAVTGGSLGSSIYVNGQTNVTINNCAFKGFATGINISNSAYVTMNGVTLTSTKNAANFVHDTFMSITNLSATSYSTGFVFSNVIDSTVINNKAASGMNQNSTAFLFYNSTNNLVTLNNVAGAPYIGYLLTNSPHNNFFNNTANSDVIDYVCATGNQGVTSEQNGLTFGYTKSKCPWMVLLNPLNIHPVCAGISLPTVVSLSADMLYNLSSTCYTVYKQPATNTSPATDPAGTVINCNGHVILSTNGGTFFDDINASSITLENCILRGFKTAIISSGSHVSILNNTILNAFSGISLSNSSYASVKSNHVINASYGILATGGTGSTLVANNFTNSSFGMQITGMTGLTVNNNKAKYGSIGLYLLNTTLSSFTNDSLTNMSSQGISCIGTSASNSNSHDTDLGQNICSSNNACGWMTTSQSCKAS